MSTSAKVIADSTYADGVRLTTIEVTMHRFVLAEMNTHRVFSRNSASSRAIPVAKQIQRINDNLAYPVSWPAEQKGMQGGAEIGNGHLSGLWEDAAYGVISIARKLTAAGLHKSVTNRILEPFMWHTVVITSTAWENFSALRLDADAQPEIRVAAEAMKAAYDASEPQTLRHGQWHAPYVDFDEDGYPASLSLASAGSDDLPSDEEVRRVLVKVSAARCARTSYLTQDGKRDIDEDVRLYDRLVTDRVEKGLPIHWSPLEHVATPWPWNRQEGCIHFGQDPQADHDTFTCIPLDHLPRIGNLLGWRSLRTEVEAMHGERTYR